MFLVASLALFAASQTQAPELSRTLTFKEAGAPTAKTIAELAKAAGVPLGVAPAAQTDTLVIDVKNIPLNTLMAKIAIATDGKWTFENGQYTLGVDDERRAKKDKDAGTLETADINALLEMNKASDELGAQQKACPGASAKQKGIAAMAPHFRASLALDNAVLAIGSQALASLQPGTRVVFSSRPTAIQRQLPAKAATALLQHYRATLVSNRSNGKRETPATVLVVLSRMQKGVLNPDDSISVGSAIYDPQGDAYDHQELSLTARDVNARIGARIGQANRAQKPLQTEFEMPIALSSEAAILFNSSDSEAEEAAKNLTPQQISKILDVQTIDPLSSIGSILCTIADTKSAQLVADLPDSLFDNLSFSDDFIYPSTLITKLSSGDSTLCEEVNGWMVISPTDGTHERAAYEPRSELAHLIGVLKSNRTLSLANFANIEPFFNGDEASHVNSKMADLTNSTLIGSAPLKLPYLALYRTLDPALFTSDGSTKISISSLNPAQKQVLNSLVFGPTEILVTESEEEDLSGDELERAIRPASSDLFLMFAFQTTTPNLQSDPTEMAPNGLPDSGSVVINVSRAPVFCTTAPMTPEMAINDSEVIPLKSLAALRAMAEVQPEEVALYPIPKKFRLGIRTSITFKIYVTPTSFEIGTLNDDAVDAGGPVYTLKTLPVNLKSEYKAQLAKFTHLARKYANYPKPNAAETKLKRKVATGRHSKYRG